MLNLPSGISPVIARWLQVEKGIMLTAENITNANIVIKEMIHLTDRFHVGNHDQKNGQCDI